MSIFVQLGIISNESNENNNEQENTTTTALDLSRENTRDNTSKVINNDDNSSGLIRNFTQEYRPYWNRRNRPYLHTRSPTLNNATISAIRSTQDFRELCTESNTVVHVSSLLQGQSYTNNQTLLHRCQYHRTRTIPNDGHARRILQGRFLGHLLSCDEYDLLQFLVLLKQWAIMQRKVFDTLFHDFLSSMQSHDSRDDGSNGGQWWTDSKKEVFLNYVIKKRSQLLRGGGSGGKRVINPTQRCKWQGYMSQLTSYLEPYRTMSVNNYQGLNNLWEQLYIVDDGQQQHASTMMIARTNETNSVSSTTPTTTNLSDLVNRNCGGDG